MRAIEKKRPPLITKRHIIYTGTIVLLSLLVWLLLYYRAIQLPHWTEQREAEAYALDATEIISIGQSYKHVWDKSTWVVSGVNEQDESIIAWILADGDPLIMRVEDGLTKEAIEDLFRSSNPGTEPVRVQAGMFLGNPVWEVYYKEGERAYYAFYHFTNGAFIDKYQLSSRTEP